jgi:hypothetical protein
MQEIPKGGKVVRYYLQEQYQLLQVPTLYTPFTIFLARRKENILSKPLLSPFSSIYTKKASLRIKISSSYNIKSINSPTL